MEQRVNLEASWLGADPNVTYVLKPMENMSDSQRKIYRSWLGLQ